MIREPAITFGSWIPWSVRDTARNGHLPGIYLLAHFNSTPPALVDSSSQEIVYIGETTEGSLIGRWQQFNRAASEGKPGHIGGMLYHEVYGVAYIESLYVAAFVPEGLSREIRALFIRYLAGKLLWDWARKWEEEPACNGR